MKKNGKVKICPFAASGGRVMYCNPRCGLWTQEGCSFKVIADAMYRRESA